MGSSASVARDADIKRRMNAARIYAAANESCIDRKPIKSWSAADGALNGLLRDSARGAINPSRRTPTALRTRNRMFVEGSAGVSFTSSSDSEDDVTFRDNCSHKERTSDRRWSSATAIDTTESKATASPRKISDFSPAKSGPSTNKTWACSLCTFINVGTAHDCVMCGCERPANHSESEEYAPGVVGTEKYPLSEGVTKEQSVDKADAINTGTHLRRQDRSRRREFRKQPSFSVGIEALSTEPLDMPASNCHNDNGVASRELGTRHLPEWPCWLCTFSNEAASIECAMCGASRPTGPRRQALAGGRTINYTGMPNVLDRPAAQKYSRSPLDGRTRSQIRRMRWKMAAAAVIDEVDADTALRLLLKRADAGRGAASGAHVSRRGTFSTNSATARRRTPEQDPTFFFRDEDDVEDDEDEVISDGRKIVNAIFTESEGKHEDEASMHDLPSEEVGVSKQARGKWIKVEKLTTKAERQAFRALIAAEFASKAFKERFQAAATFRAADAVPDLGRSVENGISVPMAPVSERVPANREGRFIIFVLGPSAAGKTYSTRKFLGSLLKKNGWPASTIFTSIDGGIMRDVSEQWSLMKRLPMARTKNGHAVGSSNGGQVAGFRNLFKDFFQKRIARRKEELFRLMLERGENMIIPDTAVKVSLLGEGKIVKMLRALDARGYNIAMAAVYASKAACTRAGSSRERKEGKRYSNASWPIAIKRVEVLFNFARRVIRGARASSFFIVNNTNHDDVKVLVLPPGQGVALRWLRGSDIGDSERDKADDGDAAVAAVVASQARGSGLNIVPTGASFHAIPLPDTGWNHMVEEQCGWLVHRGERAHIITGSRSWQRRWTLLLRDPSDVLWICWYLEECSFSRRNDDNERTVTADRRSRRSEENDPLGFVRLGLRGKKSFSFRDHREIEAAALRISTSQMCTELPSDVAALARSGARIFNTRTSAGDGGRDLYFLCPNDDACKVWADAFRGPGFE